jgi:hypothetical protein
MLPSAFGVSSLVPTSDLQDGTTAFSDDEVASVTPETVWLPWVNVPIGRPGFGWSLFFFFLSWYIDSMLPEQP